jgi:hypothetical protein
MSGIPELIVIEPTVNEPLEKPALLMNWYEPSTLKFETADPDVEVTFMM